MPHEDDDDTLTALLRAVLAHPAEDHHRLVYADRLDELGGPGNAARAEFIRVQCELAAGGLPASRESALRGRQSELSRDHEFTWLADSGLLEIPSKYNLWEFDEPMWDFRRGWVHEICLPLAEFNEMAVRKIFAHHPVTEVVLCYLEPDHDRPTNEQLAYLSGDSWDWHEDDEGDGDEGDYTGLSWVPPKLFALIWAAHPFGRRKGEVCRWVEFLAEDLARAALSAACVTYGRQLAGLPPLPGSRPPAR